MRYLILGLILFYLQSASAADRVLSSSYYVDNGAGLSFTEVRERPFQEYSGLLTLGSTDAAVWLHFSLNTDGLSDADELVARIRPSYLNEIALYYGELDSPRSVTGYQYPSSHDRYPALYPNLGIPATDRPDEIWLRLKTTSSVVIHVEVLELLEAVAEDRRHESLFTLYLAAMGLFVFWGLVHWFSGREQVMLAFVFKQLVSFSYALAYLGYVRLFWPTSLTWVNADQFMTFIILAAVPAVILFDYSFLKGFKPARGLLLLMRALMLVTPVLMLIALLGMERVALARNNMLIAIVPFVSFLAVLTIPPDRSPKVVGRLVPKRYLVALYALILVSLSFSTFASLGLVHGVEWSLNGFILHPLWTGLAIIVVLQIRAIKSEKRKLGLELALHTAEQRVVMEEARSKEQGRFLAMLTHELKTPLSVLRMVMGARRKSAGMKERANRSLEEMSSVLDRCLQSDMLESALIKPEMEPCSLSDEVRELAARYADGGRINLQIFSEQETISDVVLLRRILSNLIDNALKYSEEYSQIDIVVREQVLEGVDGTLISIANEPGKTGWPDKEKLFSKYYRAPTAHTVTGSGLGLFLIHGLAELLHGQLRYHPTDTRIIFSLWIPRSI